VKSLAALPLPFNPGDRFENNLEVDVLGCLVEAVSGKPLDEFFRIRILEPLGMKETSFYVPDNKVKRLATPSPTMRTKVSIVFPIRLSRKDLI